MLATFIFEIIVGGLFVSWIYYRRNRKELLLKIKNIPDVAKHYPIIGVLYLAIGKSPEEIFNIVVNILISTPSTICKGFLFTKLLIGIKKPEDIQKILSSPRCLGKGSPYSFFPFKNGLITSKPALWKSHRKMLNSSFHITLLHKRYMQQFNEAAQHLVTDLQCKVGMSTFDIASFVSYHTTNLQLKAMFDQDIGDEKTRIICGNSNKVFEIIGDMTIHFYKNLMLFITARLLKFDLVVERIINNNFKHMEPFIEHTRKQYLGILKPSDREEVVKTKPDILIHNLVTLENRGYFTDQDMKDHITTMLLAGADTLNVAISNCLLCLAMNEDIQEKCAIEINDVFGGQFGTINIDDLVKLELLNRTINECMRLIPTIPIIARTCDMDFQLDDNIIIPAGTDIIIPIIVVHRTKEYWGDNPTKFNPDNFLPENVAKRPLLSYIPFSYGPRNCIGKKYAQHALKVFMAYLLVNYKFSTDLKFDELKLAFGLTSILQNKYMIRIEKR